MSRKHEIIDAIVSGGLLPLFFHPSPESSTEVVKAIYDAGVRVVEYTNRGEAALDNFISLKKMNLPGMYLGIGTIRNAADAELFIAAGADFIISPGLSEDVFSVARARDILYIPGCMTPSEIMRAESLGASMVKLFPGNVLGAKYVSAIKELFPSISFMPTGGVDTTKENIKEWFDAGVAAVGMGSKLLSKTIIDEKKYSAITSQTKEIVTLIATVRK